MSTAEAGTQHQQWSMEVTSRKHRRQTWVHTYNGPIYRISMVANFELTEAVQSVYVKLVSLQPALGMPAVIELKRIQ